MQSWPAYESYTGNLGIGTLTDIIHIHFGPAPESSEHNGWGQWHRSSGTGTGMNRTIATGTGYIGQYSKPVAQRYESIETCPDELLLFLHHVPYTHVLRSGKTVIQHFYDAHYEGAEMAGSFVERWNSIHGRIDERRHRETLARLEFQAGHAIVWRDAINNWFRKKSGIPDQRGRVGHHPGRIEAEAMNLDGYAVTNITPFEAASGERAVQVDGRGRSGTIRFEYEGQPGRYDLTVQYFDESDGVSRFRLFVAGKQAGEWRADYVLPTPTKFPDAHSSNRRVFAGLALRPGDEIRIEGTADDGENALIDYVELRRTGDLETNHYIPCEKLT
jgi:alpha-glucuronidase